jgi:ADP-heptose:LPS heptosyltransferase
LPTADLLSVARIIAECDLFVGNQSCAAAIAEGLKRRMILEVYPPQANCCFDRPGRINVWGGAIDSTIFRHSYLPPTQA